MHSDRWQPNSFSSIYFCNGGYFGPRSKQDRGYIEVIIKKCIVTKLKDPRLLWLTWQYQIQLLADFLPSHSPALYYFNLPQPVRELGSYSNRASFTAHKNVIFNVPVFLFSFVTYENSELYMFINSWCNRRKVLSNLSLSFSPYSAVLRQPWFQKVFICCR